MNLGTKTPASASLYLKKSFLIVLLLLFFNQTLHARQSYFGDAIQLGNNEATNVFDSQFADLDGDGNKDLITATPFQINWYQNMGNGAFEHVKTIVSNTNNNIDAVDNILSFKVGDVNNDGAADIIWANLLEFKVLLNEGNGAFESELNQETGYNIQSIFIEKMHTDSLNYIYSASSSRDVQKWRVTGGAIIQMSFQNELSNLKYIKDINADGFRDFIVAGESSFAITLTSEEDNSEKIGFQIPTTSTGNINGIDIHTEDYDENHLPDLLVATEVHHTLRRNELGLLVLYVQEEASSFSEPIVIDTVSLGFQSAVFMDVNQDGLKDIVASTQNSGYQNSELFWYQNHDDKNFGKAQVFAPTRNSYEILMSKDVNADGLKDLLAISASGDKVILFEQKAENGFKDQHTIVSSAVSTPQQIVSFDVDNDDYNDLIVGSGNGDRMLTWYKSSSNLSFDKGQIIDSTGHAIFGEGRFDLQHADLNGNGRQDLVFLVTSGTIEQYFSETGYVSTDTTILAVYLNLGAGVFEKQIIPTEEISRGTSVSLGDFDGDGDQDIALTANISTWFENDGNGLFSTSSEEWSSFTKSTSANLDDTPDEELITSIVIEETTCDPLCISEIVNKLNFVNIDSEVTTRYQADISYKNQMINSLRSTDINSDGKTELLITSDVNNVQENKYVAYLTQNEADSVWNWVNIDSSFAAFKEAISIDIDDDGDEDIVSITDMYAYHFAGPYQEGKVLWHENDGSGRFSPNPYIDSAQVDLQQVISSDLNNDGVPEVITLLGKEEKIFIYPNEINGPINNEDEHPANPSRYQLEQNYPNPFNPSTTITYSIPISAHIELNIYNLVGQKVHTLIDEQKSAGKHRVQFNAGSLSSGMYIYRLKAGNSILYKKMVLIK